MLVIKIIIIMIKIMIMIIIILIMIIKSDNKTMIIKSGRSGCNKKSKSNPLFSVHD